MIFANIMQDKKRLTTLCEKALHKYRFVIMTDDSFEEKLSIKLNRLNILALSGLLIFFCLLVSVLLITTTSLTEYVPGKADLEVQQELISLTITADSLAKTLDSQKNYLKNIHNIISGNELTTPKIIGDSKKLTPEISFKKSIEDSLLRVVVETEDKGAIIANNRNDAEILLFFPPINGVLTDGFNAKTKHFGIDLVAKEKTRISATLEGVVVISHWTSETGYVIGVQHKNNYLSY